MDKTTNQTSASASAAPQEEKITIPNEWPGAFGIYKISKQIVMFNLSIFLILFLVSIFLNGFSSNMSDNNVLISLITTVVTFVVSIATILTAFAGIDGKKTSLSTVLSESVNYLLKFFLLCILLAAAIFGSLLLFIIPFFFVFPRLAVAPYLLIRENLSVTDAIQKSWDITKGHSAKVWGIVGAHIVFAILCLVLVGIYFLFMYQAVFAVLAIYLLKKSASAEKTAAPLSVSAS